MFDADLEGESLELPRRDFRLPLLLERRFVKPALLLGLRCGLPELLMVACAVMCLLCPLPSWNYRRKKIHDRKPCENFYVHFFPRAANGV